MNIQLWQEIHWKEEQREKQSKFWIADKGKRVTSIIMIDVTYSKTGHSINGVVKYWLLFREVNFVCLFLFWGQGQSRWAVEVLVDFSIVWRHFWLTGVRTVTVGWPIMKLTMTTKARWGISGTKPCTLHKFYISKSFLAYQTFIFTAYPWLNTVDFLAAHELL